ncbi:hypothetical protein DDB_G0271208 [Dictyostelium discoideum AX4]|uniref:Uncharacterized protein n=1 Tax=Dictyostelium discoideum TaxID=44689 RepID=Q55B80_DICDI|nr:hypothetical protein DDB_G0271208 [Dictyostelium discoideum AX4]EAL71734.1 hypothetical protein DDB_G0271208 [Dictyostelium discoideum AX4]|eukprot:XP_645732.1 hypothetical protein DDB_G0271208 [Dictyostelium discoideum AX4]
MAAEINMIILAWDNHVVVRIYHCYLNQSKQWYQFHRMLINLSFDNLMFLKHDLTIELSEENGESDDVLTA